MAKDNERRSDSKSFSPSEQNSMKIANDATVKALTLDVTINLSTPAGLVAATNPIGEAPFKDRKSTRLNSSHIPLSRMPSSA